MRKLLRKYNFLHYMGFHNKDCRRRVYTTEQDYVCLVTGNTHKKFQL
jgi:hypothetical protein